MAFRKHNRLIGAPGEDPNWYWKIAGLFAAPLAASAAAGTLGAGAAGAGGTGAGGGTAGSFLAPGKAGAGYMAGAKTYAASSPAVLKGGALSSVGSMTGTGAGQSAGTIQKIMEGLKRGQQAADFYSTARDITSPQVQGGGIQRTGGQAYEPTPIPESRTSSAGGGMGTEDLMQLLRLLLSSGQF